MSDERDFDAEARENGKKLAKELCDACNCMNDGPFMEGFAEEVTRWTHRTLQQSVARVFYKCFEEWAKAGAENRFDLRNEGTIKLSQKIIETTKYCYYLPFV